MESDFSFIELQVVQRLISKESAESIAGIIDRPFEEVAALISSISLKRNIKTFQQLADDKVQEKLAKETERTAKKVSAAKKMKDDLARQRALEKAGRIKKIQEQEQGKRRRAEPLFANRAVDYSQMVRIRIDHKTVIYCRQGCDVETEKKRYIASLNKADAIDANAWKPQPELPAKKLKTIVRL